MVGLTLGQSLGAAWQEISMPDFGRDVLGTDELASLFNQKLLGLDPDGIPAEFSSHRRDDPKSASPFAKEVPDRKFLGFHSMHGAINIAEVASDILLDRPAVPGVPIGLKPLIGLGQQRFDLLGSIPARISGRVVWT